MRHESISAALIAIPERVAWFNALKDVQLRTATEIDNGIFIAEGETVIRRAAAAGFPLRAVLAEPRWLSALEDLLDDDVDVIPDSSDRMNAITGYHVHRGALAAFGRLPLPNPAELIANCRRLVFIEGMVNHTNVGSIFRSAAAMRMDAVLIDRQCADPLYRRAIRTSMGTVFQVPWTRASLEDLVGLTTVALTPSQDALDVRSVDWDSLGQVVLMVGTEGEGLTQKALERADLRVVIPMHGGVDSLNAAAAAAVACYEINRGRA